MKKIAQSEEYKNGILEFLKFAETNLPCVKCFNIAPLKIEVVLEHLRIHGICKNYMTWTWQIVRPSNGL